MGGGRRLVSETCTLSLSPALLSGRAAHLSDPYVEVPVALDGWEAPVGVHPRSGKSEGGNSSQSPQALAACTLGSKQELSPRTALQRPFIIACASHEEGCVNKRTSTPGHQGTADVGTEALQTGTCLVVCACVLETGLSSVDNDRL